MAQTKFDKQVEETAESVMFGIGRFLAGRPMDGERKTDATFWRTGTRVLPKVEGRVSRSSYRAGWKRLTFRISGLAATGAGGYYFLWEKQDATVAAVREVWENPDPAIAAAQTGGIGLFVAQVGALGVARPGVSHGGGVDVQAQHRGGALGQDGTAVAFATGGVEHTPALGPGLDQGVAVPMFVPDLAHALGREALAGEFQGGAATHSPRVLLRGAACSQR